MPFTNLGVHGPYEILNGAFQYEEWVKKAKFLGHSSLGICEKNSLAGIFLFQKACIESNVKPIFGETITVKIKENLFDFKVYVLNEIGYKNLLKINKEINISNETKFIDINSLLLLGQGLICIIPNNIFSIFSSADRCKESLKKIELSFWKECIIN